MALFIPVKIYQTAKLKLLPHKTTLWYYTLINLLA